ncbi:Sodium-dependent glucose transporter 1A [Mizuhopecten yessoensis]|uniref:Sodium-dependent glucose transporter 1A n=1 Tax=Mizuhopecten yessoensis TaxID=6573 RepID=A0A210PYM6_MIZYE|nr:Sodium-dependent glucose transporter 1A [Mizuhopecten yessoensis]
MVAIWNKKNGKTSMQALHLGLALGGIISPLVTAPFLETESRHLTHSLSQYRDSRNDSFAHRSSEMNFISFNRTLTPFPIHFYRNLTTECDTYYYTSVLYISYAISAVLAFVMSVPFIIIYFRMQDEFDRNVDEDKERPLEPLPVTVKVIILFNMSALSAIYTCLEETFVEFLSTFCVSHLNWTKVDGSIAISLYFWSVAVGQFVNTFIVRYVDQVKLIGTYSFVLILVLTEMTFSAANYFHVAVWISPSLVGLSLSIIYPIIFTWTEDVFMPVTGRISSLFIVTGAMGSMINPTILGVLMTQYSPMWYCYLLLIESIMLFVFCISGFAMHRFTKARFSNKRDESRGILKP